MNHLEHAGRLSAQLAMFAVEIKRALPQAWPMGCSSTSANQSSIRGTSSAAGTSWPRQRSASTATMWKATTMSPATQVQKKMRAALQQEGAQETSVEFT